MLNKTSEMSPSNVFDLLKESSKVSNRRADMLGLLRALGRRLLFAVDSRLAERIDPFESNLQFVARLLRYEVETQDIVLANDTRYLLGRVDALVDICGSAIDRSLSEDVLKVARRTHVAKILADIIQVKQARPTELCKRLGIAENHLSNILKFMESAELIWRTQNGNSVLVSLGPKGEAAYNALSDLDSSKRPPNATSWAVQAAESIIRADQQAEQEKQEMILYFRTTGKARILPKKEMSGQKIMDTIGSRGQESMIFPDTSKYVELSHSKLTRIWDPDSEDEYELAGFPGAPADFWQAKELGKMIAGVVRQKEWDFDTICTMSTFALPMAYFLMFFSNKPYRIVACDNITGTFLPETFVTEEQGSTVLLIDTILQSGSHLQRAWEAIARRHRVAGSVVYFENDMLCPGEKRVPFLEQCFKDGSVESLIKASTVMKSSCQKPSATLERKDQ